MAPKIPKLRQIYFLPPNPAGELPTALQASAVLPRQIAGYAYKKVKMSIYIVRFMHQAPLTRTSLKLGRQTAIYVTAKPANTSDLLLTFRVANRWQTQPGQ